MKVRRVARQDDDAPRRIGFQSVRRKLRPDPDVEDARDHRVDAILGMSMRHQADASGHLDPDDVGFRLRRIADKDRESDAQVGTRETGPTGHSREGCPRIPWAAIRPCEPWSLRVGWRAMGSPRRAVGPRCAPFFRGAGGRAAQQRPCRQDRARTRSAPRFTLRERFLHRWTTCQVFSSGRSSGRRDRSLTTSARRIYGVADPWLSPSARSAQRTLPGRKPRDTIIAERMEGR